MIQMIRIGIRFRLEKDWQRDPFRSCLRLPVAIINHYVTGVSHDLLNIVCLRLDIAFHLSIGHDQ